MEAGGGVEGVPNGVPLGGEGNEHHEQPAVDPRRVEYERQLAEVRRRRRETLQHMMKFTMIIMSGLFLGFILLLEDLDFDITDGVLDNEPESAYPKLAIVPEKTTKISQKDKTKEKTDVDPSPLNPPGREKKNIPLWEQQEMLERQYLLGHGLCANLSENLERAEKEGNATLLTAFAELFMFGDFKENSTEDGCGKIDLPRGISLAKRAAALGSPRANALIGFALSSGRMNSSWYERLHSDGDGFDTLLDEEEEEAARQAEAMAYFSIATRGGDDLGLLAMTTRKIHDKDSENSCRNFVGVLRWYSQRRSKDDRRFWPVFPRVIHSLEERMDWNSGSGLSGMDRQDEIDYFHYRADTGDDTAAKELGKMYLLGAYGIEKNYERAYHYFSLNTFGDEEPGYPTGVAYMLENGLGVKKDLQLAYEYYKLGAEYNDPAALTRMAMLYLAGPSKTPGTLSIDKKDHDRAISLLTEASKQGWVPAIYLLATLYDNGIEGTNFKPDLPKALAFYNQAMSLNNFAAGTRATMMSKEALDPCGAAYDYIKFIRNSDYLATIFDDGDAFFDAGDYDKALARFELYSEFGSVMSQQDAAWLYKNYFKDDPLYNQKIVRFIKQSSNQYALKEGTSYKQIGKLKLDGAAVVELGDMYYWGTNGMPQDYTRAMQCYLTVASSNPQALYNIGYMHQWGIGTEKDLNTAAMYYDRVGNSPYCVLAAKISKAIVDCQRLLEFYSSNIDMIVLTITSIICVVLIFIRFFCF